MNKKIIREKILKKRDAQTEQEIEDKSIKIKEKLFYLPEFKRARTIMFYLSFKSEVKTENMVREALMLEKRVAVPVVRKGEDIMYVSEIKDYDSELTTGAYGIMSPKKEFIRRISNKEIDLIIAPGVAFDVRGYRIGYGKGFYDKFLCETKGKNSIVALAFELQIIKEVPEQNHDIQMDKIVTETRILNVK